MIQSKWGLGSVPPIDEETTSRRMSRKPAGCRGMTNHFEGAESAVAPYSYCIKAALLPAWRDLTFVCVTSLKIIRPSVERAGMAVDEIS